MPLRHWRFAESCADLFIEGLARGSQHRLSRPALEKQHAEVDTAIFDGVCRSPRIVLLDNQMLSLKENSAIDSTVKLFSSIAKLLRESPVSYEDLVCHEDALNQLLDLGSKKLDEVRMHKPNAAGLVVATNIEHAHQIALALKDKGESFQVVTTRTPDAQQVMSAMEYPTKPG